MSRAGLYQHNIQKLSQAKLDREINDRFLLHELGDPYFFNA